MTDNSDILSKLNLYAKLGELHGQNAFKIKAYSNAAFNLKKVKEPYLQFTDAELLAFPGVGKGVVESIREIGTSGTFADLDKLLEITPSGVVEMLKVKGLGPKKVATIWKEMEIDNVADLLDACRQNRLVEAKGFGLKTQAEVAHAIEFSLVSQGNWHYARLLNPASEFIAEIKSQFPHHLIEITGEMRRCSTVLSRIEIITDLAVNELVDFLTSNNKEVETMDATITATAGQINANSPDHVELRLTILGQYPVSIYCVSAEEYNRKHFEFTGSEEHLNKLGYVKGQTPFTSEEELYRSLDFDFVIPEQREGLDELDLEYTRGEYVEFWHLKGVLHNHTTYSDGLNSLKEMAEHAKYEKYQYLGICDHSRSAGYAQGLSAERLIAQMKEIDQLNEQLAPFKIFKGIESDILSDGSLDYPDEILKLLDFVVASVHSGLKMDQDKAEIRLIRAIENPYTTILGHPTGRLLLLREGYPIDHRKIIDACAANDVVIELNAHPYRLDIDWKWLQYVQKKGVKISINPDAHEKSGYGDMYFGTLAARKGGLLVQNTLNALTIDEFEAFLEQRRIKKGF